MNNTFKIKEFTNSLGVTPDLIKYYEEQGIIKPIINDTNKYRQYIFQQTREIYEAEKYRNLGFPIRKAAQLINNSSIEEIVCESRTKLNDLIIQKAILEKQIEYITNQVDYFEKLKLKKTYVIDLPPFVVLKHAQAHDFILDDNGNDTIKEWKKYFPITRQVTINTAPNNPSIENNWDANKFMNGLIVTEEDFKLFNLPHSNNVVYLPKQHYYICPKVLHRNEIAKDEGRAKFIRSIVEEVVSRNYKITGDIMRVFECFSFENDEKVLNFTVYVPIE